MLMKILLNKRELIFKFKLLKVLLDKRENLINEAIRNSPEFTRV